MADARGGNPRVLERARAGDLAGAIAEGERAIAAGDADPGLAMFVGVMCCRRGEIERGLPHLRRAMAARPDDPAPRVELGRALLGLGRPAEAAEVAREGAGAATPAARELMRIAAQADLRLAAFDAAATGFAALTASDPQDFESWDGLAGAELARGQPSAAIAAAERAVALRPAVPPFQLTLARARIAANDAEGARRAAQAAVSLAPGDFAAALELANAWAADRHYHEARAAYGHAAALAGEDAARLVTIGEGLAASRAPAEAEAVLRRVLAAEPTHAHAWGALLRVLERAGRPREVLAALGDGPAAAMAADHTAIPRARALRATGRLDEAKQAAQASGTDELVAREQLLGEVADRQGDFEAAFAHFRAAADEVRRLAGGTQPAARNYLATWDSLSALVTPEWRASWRERRPAPDPRRDPVFIFGFPRSGTTLLDALLGGHPDAVVLEEEPVIDRVAEAFGIVERLPNLGETEIARFRALYFAEAEKYAGPIGARALIDKHPLGVGSTPILHRLFPDARFVFMLRHPLDVVLSCFTMAPEMNPNVADFSSIAAIAELYAKVLTFWRRCVEALPIAACELRYEALVADPGASLRSVADFAGLGWTEAMLDNDREVAARGQVNSPSYAQVAEPIYARSSGRWRRYRPQLGEAAELLLPWIERLGYALD